MKRFILLVFLILNFNVFSQTISVLDNSSYTIEENSSVTVEKIEIGTNSIFTNNGELYISNLDLSFVYKSGSSFINNGIIYCDNISLNINQWNWLPNFFSFENYGAIVCNNDIFLKLSQRTNFILCENSVIRTNSFTIDKYGNQSVELLGTIKSEIIDISLNDGNKITFGDIISDNLILRNNAKNLTVNGFSYIENLNSNTWGNSNITVDGGLVIGNIDNNLNIVGSGESLISLCSNPTNGCDFSLTSNGSVIYRVQYDETDSFYWNTNPTEENEILGNPILKANKISYDDCILGKMNFLGIKDTLYKKDIIYHKKYENEPETIKMLKYGKFKFYIKNDKLIFYENNFE